MKAQRGEERGKPHWETIAGVELIKRLDKDKTRGRKSGRLDVISALLLWSLGLLLARGDHTQLSDLHMLSGRAAERIHALEVQLVDAVGRWWAMSGGLRGDGARYTVDLAQLATYAAERQHWQLYHTLAPALSEVIIDDPSSPYTRGMVAWRWRPDQVLDASGTTEALRVIEARWKARASHPLPLSLLSQLVEAYGRHESVDQGIWFIRNYYNLPVRAFSPNSYAVDYDPDLLSQIAEEIESSGYMLKEEETSARVIKRARTLATRSATLLTEAMSESGLVHQLIMPELSTLLPGLSAHFSSPNDIESLGNALTVAERCLIQCPLVAEKARTFLHRQARLYRLYFARTGQPASAEPGGVVEYAAATRFACKVGDRALLERFLPQLLSLGEGLLQARDEGRLYSASELLLTLSCLRRE